MLFQKKYTVYVKNRDSEVSVKSGTNLYKALRSEGLISKSLCDGSGQCGKCKIRIDSGDIPKPTKHEKLVLSPMSLESGVRLACMISVRGDIVIDTEEPNLSEADGEILEVTKTVRSAQSGDNDNVQDDIVQDEAVVDEAVQEAETGATDSGKSETDKSEPVNENEFKDYLNASMFSSRDDSDKDSSEPMFDEVGEVIHHNKQEDAESPQEAEAQPEEDEQEALTDGLLLVQLPGAVEYYHYSAGINNVSSRDIIKTQEKLSEIIRENLLSDFIHNNIKIDDIERVIAVLDEKVFEGEVIYGLVNYSSTSIGMLTCEIIQPESKQSDIMRFIRLLNISKGKRLIIPLEKTETTYFVDNGKITTLAAKDPFINMNLDDAFLDGKNPIIDVDNSLLDVSVATEYHEPDSMSLSTLFKAVALLYKTGIVDNSLNIHDRADLADKIPLEVLVKISKVDMRRVFYLYRKNSMDIYISQSVLDAIQKLRVFVRSAIKYVEMKYGKLDTVLFYTLSPCENLAEDMATLSMIPKDYISRVRTFSGDPSVFATQFFYEQDVPAYLEKNVNMAGSVMLFEDDEFRRIYKDTEENY